QRDRSTTTDATIGGFQAYHSAHRRGRADRASAVRSQRRCTLGTGDCSCRPAARSPRNSAWVPRIACWPVMGIVVGHTVGELMHVGLADQYHASVMQFCDGGGVVIRDPLGEDFGASGGSDASRSEQVLDGNRDSVQRSTVSTFAYFAFRFGRGLSPFRFGDGDEAVQLGLQ